MSRLCTVGVFISVALVLTTVVLAVVGGRGGGEEATSGQPRLVNRGELEAVEGELGHPVYWVGRRSGHELELREESEGSVYLRYLPAGSEAGDPRQAFLTVGTYPVAAASAALRHIAAKNGGEVKSSEDGTVIVVTPESPDSAYLAYRGSDLEIEVYSPQPRRALELARSGAIEQAGG